MTTYAYLRVSTADQDIQKNKFDILQLANDKQLGTVHWVEEQVSGRVSWKQRAIGDLIQQMQSGDALIVSELSRLGRSMLECMEILSVAVQRGLRLYAVKGNWQLDNSIQSKIVPIRLILSQSPSNLRVVNRLKTIFSTA